MRSSGIMSLPRPETFSYAARGHDLRAAAFPLYPMPREERGQTELERRSSYRTIPIINVGWLTEMDFKKMHRHLYDMYPDNFIKLYMFKKKRCRLHFTSNPVKESRTLPQK